MASSFFPSLLLLFSSNAPAPSDDDAARDPRERSPLRRLSCSEEGSAELALETARRRILTCCLALPNFDSGKRKKIGGKLAHPRPAFFFFSFLPRFAALALFPSLLSFPPIKKSDLSLSLSLNAVMLQVQKEQWVLRCFLIQSEERGQVFCQCFAKCFAALFFLPFLFFLSLCLSLSPFTPSSGSRSSPRPS